MNNEINKTKNGIGQKGFTLLEVIIALAIMTLTFASILTVEGRSIRSTAYAKQMNIVAMLAKNQMLEAELKIEGKDFSEVSTEETGKFPTPFEDYAWKTKIKELKFPNLSGMLSAGNNSLAQSGDMISGMISNFLTKAIREITVTILWKKASKEQSFSLTTYWVNLNNDFNLSQ